MPRTLRYTDEENKALRKVAKMTDKEKMTEALNKFVEENPVRTRAGAYYRVRVIKDELGIQPLSASKSSAMEKPKKKYHYPKKTSEKAPKWSKHERKHPVKSGELAVNRNEIRFKFSRISIDGDELVIVI